VIGERINPTGRKLLAEEMKAGDYSRVEADAVAQVAAGAHILDVNAGIPLADEPAILAETIRLVQSVTDVPLCIDSSIVAALEAGLEAYEGKALLNSVTGEEERLESVLPLVKKYGCAVIAISNDDSGISEDINVRFDVAGARGSAAQRTQGQYDLRRIQPELWLAESQWPEYGVHQHGNGGGHDLGDHQPVAPGNNAIDPRRQRDHGSRPRVHGLDCELSRAGR
jgi:hypothetical protein